jgi:ACS family sodium-dependent inorganic phosphate cotransporter
MWSSAGALLLMPAASGSVLLGVLATTLTLGTLGFSRGGFSVNHMDIAPKYAGVVMGISNTAGAGARTPASCGAGQQVCGTSVHQTVERAWLEHTTCQGRCPEAGSRDHPHKL